MLLDMLLVTWPSFALAALNSYDAHVLVASWTCCDRASDGTSVQVNAHAAVMWISTRLDVLLAPPGFYTYSSCSQIMLLARATLARLLRGCG